MDDKKDPRIYIRELPSQSSFGTQRPILPRHESSAPQDLWPSAPQILKETKLSKWVNYAYDAVLCIAPVVLMIKIGLVIWASRPGNDDNLWNTVLTRFNSQLGTLYTIIFMTTIATLFKRFALWKAQEGATVAELEQYQASISLPGTLKMIVLLRAFSWTSVGLVLLWSWFYLGSQAVSREYEPANSRRFNHTTLLFPSPEADSIFERPKVPSEMEILNVNSAFMSAVQTNPQLDRQKNAAASRDKSLLSGWASDPYNAALLPLIETTDSKALGREAWDGWRTINPYYNIQFAAKSGIPLLLPTPVTYSPGAGEPDITFTDYSSQFIGKYTMSASYIFANCSDVIFSGAAAFPSNAKPGFTTFINPTTHTAGVDNLPTVDIWTRDPKNTNSTVRGRCSLARHFVDVRGECDPIRCNNQQVRTSRDKTTPSPDTPFKNNPQFSQLFFNNLMNSAGIPEDSEPMSYSLTTDLNYTNMYYINDCSDRIEGKWQWHSMGCADLSIQKSLSQTLTILINTYMCASQANGGLLSPADELFFLSDDQQKALMSVHSQNKSWALTSQATGAPYEPTHVVVIPWIILDFVTCTILLLAAVASVWLRAHTVCPDVFGYISSMTRDNPHIPVPVGGSTMSGTERARAMKNVRVKIGEVQRQDGTPGHIGLALEHPEIPLDRLRRKGEYL